VKARQRKIEKEHKGGRKVRVNKQKLKQLEVEERFAMYKDKGQVEKYLGKKRKKMQQANKKSIPVSQK
jgi:hypothetical protein